VLTTPSRIRFLPPAALAVLLTLSVVSPCRAGEAFYLLMFGSQTTPNDPNCAHTFATFVRISWPGNEPCPPPNPFLEAFTISWLPANLKIRVNALCPECGHNFELHQTLRYVLGNDERVSLWGPYRIDGELYRRALARKTELESGNIRYKADDTARDTDRVCNCIHAISGMLPGLRVRILSLGWGETASFAVLRRMSPYLVEGERVHPWVGSALGLDCYPIIYRNFEEPRSGAIRGPINRALGREGDVRPSYGPPVR
jgi:hypothetical protein